MAIIGTQLLVLCLQLRKAPSAAPIKSQSGSLNHNFRITFILVGLVSIFTRLTTLTSAKKKSVVLWVYLLHTSPYFH